MRRIRTLVLLSLAWLSSSPAETFSNHQKDPRAPIPLQHIRRVETGFPPIFFARGHAPLTFDLQTLMKLYRVPGVSIAIIDQFKIDWTKTYGAVENGKNTPITGNTVFQAGSISKPVAAAAALSLVQQGKLTLDEDVNKTLATWKVPENEFTQKEKVTLRRLLTHSAGLTVHGFPGYAPAEPVPTLVQVLDGQKPANNPPIRVDMVPGTAYRYSGGGVTVEQQLLIDVTSEQFPQLMRELVFNKENMNDSTFEEPLPLTWSSRAASGTDTCGNTVRGRWRTYPEMAAAGLWTTPSDLARFAIDIALSTRGKSNLVLTKGMAQEMLTRQVSNVGLGFHLGGNKNPSEFRHGGSDEGFEAELIMNANSGQGIVIMTNSQNGSALAELLIESVANEYTWKYAPPRHNAINLLRLVANAKGVKAALAAYREMKARGLTSYELREDTLRQFGQEFLQCNRTSDAIILLQQNTRDHPNSWLAYDTLADAYERAGQTDQAIHYYEASVALNPSNQNAIKKLRELKALSPSGSSRRGSR